MVSDDWIDLCCWLQLYAVRCNTLIQEQHQGLMGVLLHISPHRDEGAHGKGVGLCWASEILCSQSDYMS